jgi:hypothetical protein
MNAMTQLSPNRLPTAVEAGWQYGQYLFRIMCGASSAACHAFNWQIKGSQGYFYFGAVLEYKKGSYAVCF